MPGTSAPPTRFIGILVAVTIGVYALVMAGATTAITNATAACATWPTCNGHWLIPLGDTQLLVAWGHRMLAGIVGLSLLVTGVYAWRAGLPRTVLVAILVAIGIYPIQIGLGALIAIQGPATGISGLHLAVAMGIFGVLVFALVRTLEAYTPTAHIGLTSPNNDENKATRQSSAPPPTSRDSGLRVVRTIRAYATLMKPRLMWLLSLVAVAGMGLAAGDALTIQTVVATLTGGVLAIGASGTFNNVLERDVDRRMARTADRPLVVNIIPVRRAFIFGVLLTIGSILVFFTINLLAAVLGFAAILYYSVVYTLLLKPNTVQNTVIGGFAGSFPALIGAVAASNKVGLPALLLAAIIFLWTPAHFYNLAIAYKDDYQRGGFPMLPVERGTAVTCNHILYYMGGTFLMAAVLAAVGDLSWVYAVTTIGVGIVFLVMIIRLYAQPSQRMALKTFHASNLYLGGVLIAIVVDTILL